MASPTAKDEAFVAYAQPCGHIVAATWIDDPKRAAKTAAAWLARGDEVRRVDGEKIRSGKAGEWCKCGSVARLATRPAARGDQQPASGAEREGE